MTPKIKSLTILSTIICCHLIAACSKVKINDDETKKTLIKSAARIAGMVLTEKHPEYAIPATVVCKSIASAENDGVGNVVAGLFSYVETNAALKATLKDVLNLIEIDTQQIDASKIELVRCAAEAFLEGLTLPMTS